VLVAESFTPKKSFSSNCISFQRIEQNILESLCDVYTPNHLICQALFENNDFDHFINLKHGKIKNSVIDT